MAVRDQRAKRLSLVRLSIVLVLVIEQRRKLLTSATARTIDRRTLRAGRRP